MTGWWRRWLTSRRQLLARRLEAEARVDALRGRLAAARRAADSHAARLAELARVVADRSTSPEAKVGRVAEVLMRGDAEAGLAADGEAIAGDWRRVADDLRRVMGQVAQERTEGGGRG